MADTSLNSTTFGGLTPLAQGTVDDLCDAFERQRKSSAVVVIDEYLNQAPVELRAHLLSELVAIDVEYRRKNGEHPQLSDYDQRFPTIEAAWFKRMLMDSEEALNAMTCPDTSVSERGQRVGQVLGEYELCSELGRGGMGEVYLARHCLMDREVAIKLVTPELLRQPDAVRRFHREVTTAAKLVHANIVTAYDAGQCDGRHFLVMQYVPGVDLRTLVARDGPLPIATAVDYIIQSARGLAYAHEQGVVHRDVKPSNLLLDTDGIVKVLDLGLALRDGGRSLNEARLTTPDMVIGTPGFMAPEQCTDPGNADHRADIYSLGCTLFFLLTGRPPYGSSSAVDTILAHQRAPIPSLTTATQDAPSSLIAVYTKMMAKQPDDRFASMDATIEALQQTIAAKPVIQPPPVAVSPKPASPRQRLPRRRALLFASGATLLLIAAGITLVYRSTPDLARPPRLTAPQSESTARDVQKTWAKYLGVQPTITNTLGIQLVLIPPGEFTMGTELAEVERLLALPDMADHELDVRSEAPAQPRHIEHPFWIASTEVTAAQFRRFVIAESFVTEAERSETGGWGIEHGDWIQRPGFYWNDQGDRAVLADLPVSNITWNDAMAFCAWLSRTETSLAGGPIEYRLPSETEWEFACRAGSETRWFWGDDSSDIGDYVWYAGNADRRPHVGGQKRANSFGLFDMLGNDMEWCRDELLDNVRVQRGGSFFHPPHLNRCASRRLSDASSPTHGAFRVLRVISIDH